MSEFPIIATLVSTFLAGGLGALWYGPLCGNAWLAAGGKTKEEIDDGAKPIMIAMLTWLVTRPGQRQTLRQRHRHRLRA